MEFTIKSGSPEKQRSACVVVGVFDNRKLSLSAELIDRASNGYISEIIRRGDMEGKLGAHAAAAQRARHAGRPRAARGIGQGARLPRPRVPLGDPLGREAAERNRLLRGGCLPHRRKGQATRSRLAGRARGGRGHGGGLPLRADEEPAHRSSPAAAQAHAVGAAALRPQRRARRRPRAGLAIAHGMDLARDLGNLPGNICTPTYLGERAVELAREFPDITVKVLERKEMRGARHGLVPRRHQRQRAAAALHRPRVHANRRASRREPWCWSARASRSTPAASRSSLASTWTR